MKLGIAGNLAYLQTAAECGYDHFEAQLAPIMKLSDEEFAEIIRTHEQTRIKARYFICFFDGNVNLYGCSDAWLKEYCDKVFPRAASLGGEIAVIGSGAARSIPSGMPREECEKRFIEIMRIIGKKAEQYKMKTVIEPLNKKETDFINTVPEAVDVCRKTDMKNVGTMVDFYHFSVNGENLDELYEAKDFLWHVHVARPFPDRGALTASDITYIKPFAETLKKIGYNGSVTLECVWKNFAAEAEAAKPVMSVLFGKVD